VHGKGVKILMLLLSPFLSLSYGFWGIEISELAKAEKDFIPFQSLTPYILILLFQAIVFSVTTIFLDYHRYSLKSNRPLNLGELSMA
jgi:hypothetical protein